MMICFRSLSRLFDPINLMFSTSSRDKSSSFDQDELKRIFRVIGSELSIAQVDQGLLLAVSKSIAKTVNLVSHQLELISISRQNVSSFKFNFEKNCIIFFNFVESDKTEISHTKVNKTEQFQTQNVAIYDHNVLLTTLKYCILTKVSELSVKYCLQLLKFLYVQNGQLM